MPGIERQVRGIAPRAALLSLLAGVGLLACVAKEEDAPTAEDLAEVKQHLLSEAPSPRLPVNADLDGKVVYLGLDVEPAEVEPGKDVTLTHYWKVIEPPGAGWRMFTHVNGPNLSNFMNVDHGPVRGKYPVHQWKAGDIIRDVHTIRLPATWPHDTVEIYTGIWKGNLRLPVRSGAQDGSNRVLAARLPVKGAAVKPLIERRYVVRKLRAPIKLDGDLADWKDIPTAGVLVNSLTGEPVRQLTDVRMAWDDKHLYLALNNQDDDVWGTLKKRDDKLWQEEAVEVMIDANGDGRSYVEFQVSPRGTLFDTYLPEYRKYEDSVDPKMRPFGWNSGFRAAVKVDGTLDNRDDTDRGWTVEIAIPFADVNGLAKDGARVPPKYGDTWKLNIFRLDRSKDGRQEAAAWSPPMVGDFHKLDRFGEILFADALGQVPPAPGSEAAAARSAAQAEEADRAGGKVVAPDPAVRAAQVDRALKGLVPPPGGAAADKGGQALKLNESAQ